MTSLDWGTIAGLSDQDAAEALTGRVRQIDAILRTAYIELGLICQAVETRKLWQLVQNLDRPITSFNTWLAACCPYSRSHAYGAKAVVLELSKDIEPQNLIGIDETNARLLTSVSSNVRREPEVIEAAKRLSGDEFRVKIAVDYPDQHIEESMETLKFRMSAGDAAIVRQALQIVGEKTGISDPAGELLALAIDFVAESVTQ